MANPYRFKFKRDHPILNRPVWSLQNRSARFGTWLETREIDTMSEQEMRDVVKVLNRVWSLNEEQRSLIALSLKRRLS
jgi:hypothetical protein